jgi:hypothetical protein
MPLAPRQYRAETANASQFRQFSRKGVGYEQMFPTCGANFEKIFFSNIFILVFGHRLC